MDENRRDNPWVYPDFLLNELWIGDALNGERITFPNDPDRAQWELQEKLSEAHQHECLPHEARAVYVCKQLRGPCVGTEAIIKVRMQ
jgi:hypothetical protein